MEPTQLLLLIFPLVVVQLVLLVLALRELLNPERRVVGDNKPVWGLVIVLFGILGPLVYFLAGRQET